MPRADGVSFRGNREAEALRLRSSSPGGAAKRIVKRYLYLAEKKQKQIATTFTEAELCLLMQALKGIWLDERPEAVLLIPPSVELTIETKELDCVWSVDRESVIRKLRALSDVDLMSLADIAELFWNQYNSKNPIRDRLIELGLVN